MYSRDTGRENIYDISNFVEIRDVNGNQTLAVDDDRIRDWGSIQGYMKRPKEQGWKTIESKYATQLQLLEQEEPEETLENERENYYLLLQNRLKEIKGQIKPRLEMANKQADKLLELGVTPNGARLMMWIGWIGVAALGWVFSWILQQVIDKAQSSPGQPSSGSSNPGDSVNDIFTLFVRGFEDIQVKILAAFPGLAAYKWVFPVIGILMTLTAIVSYLMAKRVSGDFKPIEDVVDIVAHGTAKPDDKRFTKIEKNLKDSQHSEEYVAKEKSKWFIIAIALGLPGIGILLSSIQQGSSLSIILLGFALAAMVVSAMMLIVHFTFKQVSWQENQPLSEWIVPKWFFKTISIVTFSLLSVLFLSLLLYGFSGSADVIIKRIANDIAVLAIGVFLLTVMVTLALGIIYNNIFKNENHWIMVKAQIDRRLRNIELQKAIPKVRIEKKKREKFDQKQLAKAKIIEEIERLKHIYEQAYEIGFNARTLQENRLSGLNP